uniref:AAA+ ATPase domain-containing protein n=1 Tax=Aureoumbra lagunensis TaxID=44058 RepID=A0A7S3K4Q6_9STRA|mmetsp:Transcript_8974/g.13800  ORF Transcript_8974/g.13800 Transcript_8974/m.13800 type:complete len:1709 (+) Transcript_8974:43-5169(+)
MKRSISEGENDDAKAGLSRLLQYIQELQQLHAKDKGPRTVLEEARPSSKRSVLRDTEALVLHETVFRKLEASGLCVVADQTQTNEEEEGASRWLCRIRRPEAIDDTKKKDITELACATYSELFALRQEKTELVVGLGLVRWGQEVSHPVVEFRACADLDSDGAVIVRVADTPQLWPFPGIPQFAPALPDVIKALAAVRGRPRPSDKGSWAPFLRSVAHALAADGSYVNTPPNTSSSTGTCKKKRKTDANNHKAAAGGGPIVYNCFAIYCREAVDEAGSTSEDAEAMRQALVTYEGDFPIALSRLAGLQPDEEAQDSDSRKPPKKKQRKMTTDHNLSWRDWFLNKLLKSFGYESTRHAIPQPPLPLCLSSQQHVGSEGKDAFYFGLPSNEQQEQVIKTLEAKGCCVCFGPPGTGKSQTIVNVICHYAATGRRVLVTSKLASATEVVRKKLPHGIRELCVSLGDADAASFRRLEAAVARLADDVAAASLSFLKNEADSRRRVLHRVDNDCQKSQRDFLRAAWRSVYEAPQGLHHAHIRELLDEDDLTEPGGISLSLAKAADKVLTRFERVHAAVIHDTTSGSKNVSFEQERKINFSRGLQPRELDKPLAERRPAFLADCKIDPERVPPREKTIEELRRLRRGCAEILGQGEALAQALQQSSGCALDAVEASVLRNAATKLREKRVLDAKVRLSLLPRVLDVPAARRLLRLLEVLGLEIFALERSCAANRQAWMLSALRRAYDPRVLRAVKRALYFADKILELAPRGLQSVQLPDLLLRVVSRAAAAKAQHEEGSADPIIETKNEDLELLGDDIEFARELQSRCAPVQSSCRGNFSWISSFFGSTSTRSALIAELDFVRVGDARPTTPAEWRCVERRLILRAASVRLRAHVLDVCRLVSGSDWEATESAREDDAATFERARTVAGPLRQLVAALITGRQVHEEAHIAVAAASPLEAAARGSSSLAEDTTRLREALSVHQDNRLDDALKLRSSLLNELEPLCAAENAMNKQQPFALLREATLTLLAISNASNEQSTEKENESIEKLLAKWLDARSRIRRGRASLITLTELRRVCRNSDLARMAPAWAKSVCSAPVVGDDDAVLPRDARKAWAAVAAAQALERVFNAIEVNTASNQEDASQSMLLERRDAAVRALVSAVAKAALRQRMSPKTCAALVRLVSAVSAAAAVSSDSQRYARLREDLASAMADCADKVPVWIMPLARVAQCLPATISQFELVIVDEASQLDASAIPALLRGAKILIVGDHKQVSPTAAFVAEKDMIQLSTRLSHPYKEQLLPGRSIFDLASCCFADARVGLTQHFRCVPSCIAFSNAQFYLNSLEPRRLPSGGMSAALQPSLVDIRIPNGKKVGKTNDNEARAVANYLKLQLDARNGILAKANASIAVISLLGIEQARLCRRYALEVLTDSQLAKHRVVFGDPPMLQGDERDVVLLSMVASPRESSTSGPPAQVGPLYTQRYNVAMSRARHKIVLFRSLDLKHVPNADDLKHRLIAFFQTNASGSTTNLPTSPTTPPADASAVQAQVLRALADWNYVFDISQTNIAGSLCVVRGSRDARLCVCIDAGSLDDYAAKLQDQIHLERSGFKFFRQWEASWIVDPSTSRAKLRAACLDIGAADIPQAASVSSPRDVIIIDSPTQDDMQEDDELDDEDDTPTAGRRPAAKPTAKPASKSAKRHRHHDDDDDDDFIVDDDYED